MKLLIIEDEKYIASPLIKGLTKKGFAVDWAKDGKEGEQMGTINSYDCVLLDINLPFVNGYEVAKKIRQEHQHTPILMLTAKSSIEEKWEGFEAGTDDYLTKPFDFTELVYRINALIRRSASVSDEVIELNGLRVNISKRFATYKGERLDLNNKEFCVLEYMLRNKGRPISQEELLEHVWDSEIDLFTMTVRTTIKTLRKKVDPDKKLIITQKGVGYVIY